MHPDNKIPKIATAAQFWDNVFVYEGCWYWRYTHELAWYKEHAYVQGPLLERLGSSWSNKAPRIAYCLAYGLMVTDIPKDMQISHECKHHTCVNPLHLELKPQSENMRLNDKKPVRVTPDKVRKYRALRAEGYKTGEAARIVGIGERSGYKIDKGETHKKVA